MVLASHCWPCALCLSLKYLDVNQLHASTSALRSRALAVHVRCATVLVAHVLFYLRLLLLLVSLSPVHVYHFHMFKLSGLVLDSDCVRAIFLLVIYTEFCSTVELVPCWWITTPIVIQIYDLSVSFACNLAADVSSATGVFIILR